MPASLAAELAADIARQFRAARYPHGTRRETKRRRIAAYWRPYYEQRCAAGLAVYTPLLSADGWRTLLHRGDWIAIIQRGDIPRRVRTLPDLLRHLQQSGAA